MDKIRLKINDWLSCLGCGIKAHFTSLRWYHYLLDGLFAVGIIAAVFGFNAAKNAPDPRLGFFFTVDGHRANYLINAKEQAPTVGEFMSEQGITHGSGDVLSHKKDDIIEPGMEISLTRAFPVAVRSMGEVHIVYTSGGTVGDALRQCGVEYDTADEVNYMMFEPLAPGMKIVHTDVVTEYTTAMRSINYKEKVVYDDDVYNDTEPVYIQRGEKGSRQVTQRIVIKNGIEVSREVVNQIVITPPTDEIVKKGSKIHYQTHLTGEYRIYKKPPKAGKDGWVEMKMDYITAYWTGHTTATGHKPKLGTIAVNPHYIPYGTQIYVKGYGYGVARDTGAFRNYKNSDGSLVNQLDLWMNTESEGRRWGRKRNVTVLVKLG